MKYFLTGVPGTGKTTLGKILGEKGYKFIDVDHEPNLANWYNIKTGERAPKNPEAGAEWYLAHDWNWNREVLEKILKENESIFICGITSNQEGSLDLFDKIFLLILDPEEIRRRRHIRKKKDEKPDDEHDFIWHEGFNKNLIQKGVIAIDASYPVEELVERILNLIR